LPRTSLANREDVFWLRRRPGVSDFTADGQPLQHWRQKPTFAVLRLSSLALHFTARLVPTIRSGFWGAKSKKRPGIQEHNICKKAMEATLQYQSNSEAAAFGNRCGNTPLVCTSIISTEGRTAMKSKLVVMLIWLLFLMIAARAQVVAGRLLQF
jgi:hypothetical protein